MSCLFRNPSILFKIVLEPFILFAFIQKTHTPTWVSTFSLATMTWWTDLVLGLSADNIVSHRAIFLVPHFLYKTMIFFRFSLRKLPYYKYTRLCCCAMKMNIQVLVVDETQPVQQNVLSYLSSEVSAESEALELHNLLPIPLHTYINDKWCNEVIMPVSNCIIIMHSITRKTALIASQHI